MFMHLPCDQPDPLLRLIEINRVTQQRKRSGEPRGAQAVFDIVSHTPHTVQRALTRMIASPRTFNLVVSNIPGPTVPLYMHGCRLVEAYPVVPLAEHHALSVGVTTVGQRACFGLYADRRSLPEADAIAHALDREIEELLRLSGGVRNTARRRSSSRRAATPTDSGGRNAGPVS
jgi:hypothetical protein